MPLSTTTAVFKSFKKSEQEFSQTSRDHDSVPKIPFLPGLFSQIYKTMQPEAWQGAVRGGGGADLGALCWRGLALPAPPKAQGQAGSDNLCLGALKGTTAATIHY